jgi:hypothetical protein
MVLWLSGSRLDFGFCYLEFKTIVGLLDGSMVE